MVERVSDAEVVLDDELFFDDGPRGSSLLRREERREELVREGEVLAGKYRVERIPGRNGLGVVVQVRHLELGQAVTLKFLVSGACAFPEFVQRFIREARAAVRIQGEHVARVTDVGRLEWGAPYMVREYLRGPDLAEVLKVRGQLPVAEAIDYVIQAAEAVAEGHALGIAHRNLRPTSIVVARRSDGSPLVKVFDFAAAEALHVDPFTERAVSLVGTSAIMASLPYLSPEQVRDPHDVDFRADVYALGAILHELLSGVPVYRAESAPALLSMVAADGPVPLRNLRAELSPELEHLVLRCLSKNRNVRYASIADLALALRPYSSSDSNSSIERIVRLGRRTSRPPALGAPPTTVPTSAPPATAPMAMQVASVEAGLGAQPFDTEELTVGATPQTSPLRNTMPLSSFAAETAACVAAHVPPPVTSSPPAVASAPQLAGSPLSPLSAPPATRRTPTPPPLHQYGLPAMAAPPPRSSPPPAAGAPAAGSVRKYPSAPPAAPVSSQTKTTLMPPPRASRSSTPGGMARSWAAPEPTKPLFVVNRKLVGIGAIAACATLGVILGLRFNAGAPQPAASAVAARPPEPTAQEKSWAAVAQQALPAAVPSGAALTGNIAGAESPTPGSASPAAAPSAPPPVTPAPAAAPAPAPAAPAAAPAVAVAASLPRVAAPAKAQKPAAPKPEPARGGNPYADDDTPAAKSARVAGARVAAAVPPSKKTDLFSDPE